MTDRQDGWIAAILDAAGYFALEIGFAILIVLVWMFL